MSFVGIVVEIILFLSLISLGVDVLYVAGNRGVVLMATSHGATVAALGRPDVEVVYNVVNLGYNTLVVNNVSVTACSKRTQLGDDILVETRWTVKFLSPVLAGFWAHFWRGPLYHRSRTTAIVGCVDHEKAKERNKSHIATE